MFRWWRTISILCVLALLLGVDAFAKDVSKAQIKGLDEQVQEIKGDVLAIAAELGQLEERLLYPSNTQIAVFVSLEGDDNILPDALEIKLDGKTVATHLYSFKEIEALKKGGVQRIYTGNIRSGEHDLQVTLRGKTGGGSDFMKTENTRVKKGVDPRIVHISLDSQKISITER